MRKKCKIGIPGHVPEQYQKSAEKVPREHRTRKQVLFVSLSLHDLFFVFELISRAVIDYITSFYFCGINFFNVMLLWAVPQLWKQMRLSCIRLD